MRLTQGVLASRLLQSREILSFMWASGRADYVPPWRGPARRWIEFARERHGRFGEDVGEHVLRVRGEARSMLECPDARWRRAAHSHL